MTNQKKPANFSTEDLPRPRWNVLDLIDVFAKEAVPTYMFCDVDMTWAESLRKKLKSYGQKVTVTAILLKAIAIAQRAHPESRTQQLPWGKTVTLNDICAGFTVERVIGQQPAVFFGSIENPDTKSVEEIAGELRQYAESSIESVPSLKLQDKFCGMPRWLRRIILWAGLRYPKVRLHFFGATFGFSSLGKWGMKGLIPPCVATSTFGIGEVEDRAVVREGQIEIRPMLTIILNFDHRIIDGAPAARFMADVKRLLEGGLENYLHLGNYPEQENINIEKAAPSFS